MASVPAAHPYVTGLGSRRVDRLPDPPVPGAPAGQWWPPQALDPAWIAAHADRFDLLHVHFGTESLSTDAVRAAVAALAQAGRPLVLTVHDLVNPQLTDQARHEAHLDVLVPAAAALVTLTEQAATEVVRRWGRTATVVPHPAVLTGPAPPPTARAPGDPFVVGVHLRDLRPNVDGPGSTTFLLDAVARLRAAGQDVRARVHLHDRVRDEAAADAVGARCAAEPWAEVVQGSRPDDPALHRELVPHDATVLPYRHGTHSGWLELCWDLAVPVAAPRIGCLADQHPGDATIAAFTPGDAADLARALDALLHAGPGAGTPERTRTQDARASDRAASRAAIADAQLAVYERALGRPAPASRTPA